MLRTVAERPSLGDRLVESVDLLQSCAQVALGVVG